MDEQHLIYLVEQHECLYNLEHKDYGNNLVKDSIWKQIAEELNVEVDECKSKWTMLRSYYRRAKHRRKSLGGNAAKKMKKWRYEDQMQFLKPHLQEREHSPNFKIEEALQVNCDTEDAEYLTPSPLPSPVNNCTPWTQFQPRKQNDWSKKSDGLTEWPQLQQKKLDGMADWTQFQQKKSDGSAEWTQFQPRKSDRVNDWPQFQQRKSDGLSESQSEFIPLKDSSKSSEKQQLMVFFDDIAESVLKFPPMDKLEIKREIFNLVNKKEMELLRKRFSNCNDDNHPMYQNSNC